MKRKNKTSGAAAPLNPVLETSLTLANETSAEGAIATLEAAPGFHVIERGSLMTMPGLERFPLAISDGGKSGIRRYTGGLMNIAEFVRTQTIDAQHPNGMAFNDAHKKAWNEKHPSAKLRVVVPKDIKATLSAKLDSFRRPYFDTMKTLLHVVASRPDAEVQTGRLSRTRKGLTYNAKVVIPTGGSQESILATENARLKAELAAIKANPAGAKLAKQVEEEQTRKPIDIAAAMSPAGTTVVPPAAAPQGAPAQS